ncbi:MAG: hypothetical protein AB7N99_08430 [Simkaniaceae bacterium]
MKFLSLFLIATSMLSATPLMTDNYVKGKDIAEAHALPMALIFTGSDWSENCKGLLKEIFAAELPKEWVFVHIDFPELNVQPQEILEQNHTLKDRYNIHAFPTVVLVGTDRNEITRLGYPLPGISSFAHHLQNLGHRYLLLKKRFEKAKKDRSAGELNLCFQEARALGSEVLAKEILRVGTEEVQVPELVLEKYTALVGAGKMEEALALRQVLLEEGKEETLERMALLDFQEKESIEPLEAFLEKYSKGQGEHFWRMHLVISEFLLKQDQRDEALEHAQISYRYAPPENKEDISILISKMLH